MTEITLNPERRFEENNPAFWRFRAEEARTTADQLKDADARKHMLAAAASYDRLAETAEKLPKPSEYWRARAEEVRARASLFSSAEAQGALLKVAERYDGLARLAEQKQEQGRS